MVKQYFVMGRNPELSREEILAYSNARNLKPKEIMFEENFLLLEITNEININNLGGTLKSGLIEKEGPVEIVEAHLVSDEIIPEDKFTFSVYGNVEPEVFKFKFKSDRKKAILKHGRRRIKFQNKEKVNIASADHYLILHLVDKTLFFGRINQEYDSKSVEFRDMKKPVRREHLAISPRLSKILINLSGAKENDFLLDPFCGIGGILQEALLLNLNVHGSDKDMLAIRDARKNLSWLKSKYKIQKRFDTETKDVRKLTKNNFDAIATETPLGDVFRKKPNNHLAKQILQRFEGFIIPALKHLKKIKKNNAKIAITFPRIQNNKIDYQKIEEETELKIIVGPIHESRDKQFISREILVFI